MKVRMGDKKKWLNDMTYHSPVRWVECSKGGGEQERTFCWFFPSLAGWVKGYLKLYPFVCVRQISAASSINFADFIIASMVSKNSLLNLSPKSCRFASVYLVRLLPDGLYVSVFITLVSGSWNWIWTDKLSRLFACVPILFCKRHCSVFMVLLSLCQSDRLP